MSWSFNGIGKPAAVAKRAAAELSRVKCHEPEETVKAKVIEILGVALDAFPGDTAVKVEAYGSQSVDSTQPGKARNSLTLKIEPLYGFME